MVRPLSLAALICVAAFLVRPVSAGEIAVEAIDGMSMPVIFISGELQRGDEQKFRRIALENDNALVVLDSPGGAVVPALEIGRAINISGFPTAVIGDSLCTSACALIWLAGSARALSADAKLGFHASYRDENGVALESGVANALVGQYLTQLGLPSKAILFATLAPPNDFLWLNESTAEQSGISFRLLDGGERSASSPARKETPSLVQQPQSSSTGMSHFEERLARFPKDWVAKKAARHGMDVTIDGRMWFNTDTYGDTDDYGVSADDLWAVSGRYRKAWVRGYHKRNPALAYRESLHLIHADCAEKKWGSEMEIHYGPNGDVVHESSGPWEWSPVVPRSYAESWYNMICAD